MRRTLLIVLFLLCSPVVASASGHANVDENMPTELDDADALERGVWELQGIVRYADEKPENRVLYQPQIEMGILPRTQLTVGAIFYGGNADREGSGALGGELLYVLVEESARMPALAAALAGELPTGVRSNGVDTTAKLLLSKRPSVSSPARLHANLVWKRNAGRDREEERHDMFGGILGASCTTGPHTSVILDYLREQKEEKHEEANLVEAGLRHNFTHAVLGAIGVGVGIGPDSERYRITVGLQQSF